MLYSSLLLLCLSSCTQEEILQVCCPEFNVGMLFIGTMMRNEVVNVTNCRRYSSYTGYGNSFTCAGPLAAGQTVIQDILTIDACYSGHFSIPNQLRDINKAFTSFSSHANHYPSEELRCISTGKWGCGVFGGVVAHKFLQQLISARLAGVAIEFSAFGGDAVS